MIVLSLFNGMNTGRVALDNVGIKVEKYYSSEIKPYAIELTQHHHPDTIQLGDVTKWKEWQIEWGEIDLILSGSPCQDLSIAGKRKGLEGENSSLFWVFIDILNHIKSLNPNVLFLQENVGSAPKLDVLIMSRALGVLPVRINSNLVTAQNRDRYYWTNIRTRTDWTGDVFTDIPQPADRKIFLKDIIESGEVDKDKSSAILERTAGSNSYKDMKSDKAQINFKKRDDKGFITCVKEPIGCAKPLTKTQEQALIRNQEGMIIGARENVVKVYSECNVGDGIDLAFPNSKTRRGRVMEDKSNALLEAANPLYINKGYYLRLFTQTELERLQGFPDGYTSILSYNKASSLLGDGWTLPVIEHIFSFLKNQ